MKHNQTAAAFSGLSLGAAAALCLSTAFAQPTGAVSETRSVDGYEIRSDLISILRDLDQGNHDQAISTVEQLRLAITASYDAQLLGEVDAMQDAIWALEDNNHVETAWGLQLDLIRLSRANPDDL